MTKEERLAALGKLRKTFYGKRLNADMQALVQQHPGLLKAGTTITDFSKLPGAWRADFGKFGQLIGLIRNQIRTRMFANPLPHGMKNLGEFMVGFTGISSVPRALYHMLHGLDPAMKSRLEQGAMETYTRGYHKSVYSLIPGAGPVWDKWIGITQKALTRMEEGWRAAALEHVDNILGPSKDKLDELMKLQMVAQRIGDPHNQAAVVRIFEALGGPFLAYHWGIVPKNMIMSIAEDPSRWLSMVRPQVNMQQSRSRYGQSMNEFELGGPATGIAQAGVDVAGIPLRKAPTEYFLSPSALGPMGSVEKPQYAGDGPLTSWGQTIAGLALPPEAQQIYEIYNKQAMPGPYYKGQPTYQPMTLPDQLTLSVIEAFASYFKRQQSAATQKRTRGEIEKGTP